MRCPYCGKELINGAKFCDGCGAQLEVQQPQFQQQPQQMNYGYGYGYRSYYSGSNLNKTEENILQAQWDALPNYVEEGTNAIVIADTSGSMYGRPMDTAVSLAIYFAQRNTGAYKNLWMNFSSSPSYQTIKGKTLKQILSNIDYGNWSGSTNCAAAFELILSTAIKNHVPVNEMPKSTPN